MTYYLIDYENTGENGLNGISDLGNDERVVIFYSENADKMSFDLHQKLGSCRANVEYRKIATGKKNALDFQLSTYLGYLVAKNEQCRFYIVSKDTGYEMIIDFWKEKKIKRIDAISMVKEASINTELLEGLKQFLPDEDQDVVYRIIMKYKTKQGVNNALVKQYGSEKAGDLYKRIKPLMKDKKGK